VGAGHSEATAEPELGESKVIIVLEHVKIGSGEVKSKG